MRKLSILFTLCLFLSMSAHAAPTREYGGGALEHMDLVAQVQPLVDAVAAAAIRQGVYMFRQGTTPDTGFVEGLLYQALNNHLIVREANDGIIRLGEDDALAAAGSLALIGDVAFQGEPVYPGMTLADGALRFDLSRQEDHIGAHIYDVSVDEEEVLVSADIYRLSGIVASAQDAPDESLTWVGHIGLRLKPQPDSAIGFVLASFAVPERYRESAWLHFVEKDRFELQYPGFLTVETQREGAFLSLGSEDGLVNLSVRDVAGSMDDLLADWLSKSEGGDRARIGFVESGRLMLYGPGIMGIAYADPQDGQDNCLLLEMTFPEDILHEFTLYHTFLNNSFVVYSQSVG